VSVVVPAYNAGRLLAEAVSSVLEQAGVRLELLIVEDGSSDDTLEIAEALSRSPGGAIRVLRHPGGMNRGVSASRNLGLRSASGRFVAFIDADDLYLPRHLYDCVRYLEDHPEVGMVATPFEVVAYETEMSQGLKDAFDRHNREFRHGETVSFERLLEDDPMRTSSVVGRPAVFREVGGFDEDMPSQEDWALWAKVALRSRIAFIDVSGIRYRYHDRGMTAGLLRELDEQYFRSIRADVHRRLLSWLVAEGRASSRYAVLVDECSTMPLSVLAGRRDLAKKLRSALRRTVRGSLLRRAMAGFRSPPVVC
jgi:glycosyltransferase involved in cell wall biosynthesis